MDYKIEVLTGALEKIMAKEIPDGPHQTQTFIAEVFNICEKALAQYNAVELEKKEGEK